MKKMILTIGIFISFSQSIKAQLNVPESAVKTIHSYDSLILAIEKDTALLRKKIIGAAESKSYKGFAFLIANSNELSKLDILFEDPKEERVIIYLFKNKIINISIAESNHYIINDNCFGRAGTSAGDCDEILKSVPRYRDIVKNLLTLFFEN